MSTEQTNQPPIETIRDKAMVIKLWEHNGKNGPFVTATLGRTYKNEQTGEFGEARSFSREDLLKAGSLFHRANDAMLKWEEYYREQGPAINQQQGQAHQAEPTQAVQQPVQSQPVQQSTQAAPQQPAQQSQNMADQRDQAVSNAVPSAPAQTGPSHEPQM